MGGRGGEGYRRHEGVKHTDGKGSPAGKRLGGGGGGGGGGVGVGGGGECSC